MDFSKIKSLPEEDLPPEMLGKCTKCNYQASVSTFEEDYDHHDGWEMPAYAELICPKCPDGGCVDDFTCPEEYDRAGVVRHLDKLKEKFKND